MCVFVVHICKCDVDVCMCGLNLKHNMGLCSIPLA